jgi:4-hydroxybenzoyl-CoA thioesterase
MPFECRIPVRFGDIDIAKIVYYPRFLHFCHVAMEEMFGAVIGVPYHETVMREKVGYPTVKAEAEYLKPVGFGETIRMEVTAEHLGTSSVRFLFRGYRVSDGELAFRVKNTCVAVDMDAWKSVSIPVHHRAGFERLRQTPGSTGGRTAATRDADAVPSPARAKKSPSTRRRGSG